MKNKLIGLMAIVLSSQLLVSCAAHNPRANQGAMAGGGIEKWPPKIGHPVKCIFC
jgi:hypothetical protein